MRNQKLSPFWDEIAWESTSPWQREVARLFNGLSSNVENQNLITALIPKTNAEETETHYLLSFELPGVEKENIAIDFKNHELTVTAKQAETKLNQDGKMHIRERYEGEFKRVLRLPETIDTAEIKANYHNGVLHVSVPKAEIVKPKRIEVADGKNDLFVSKGNTVETEKKVLKSA